MNDFTLVKKYLKEIVVSKPGLISDNEILSQLEDITPLQIDENNLSEIFKPLINYPQGKSISKEGMPRLIVLSILVIDNLISILDQSLWENYIEFRCKAFSLLLENDKDPEASELYKNLAENISRFTDNPELEKKLQNQRKIYKRKIGRKIKELETLKQFDKAGLLNSMYGTVPSYIYEPRIEEKEKKHLEWHFLQPLYKIIIDALLILFVYGLNLRFLKHYKNGNLFTYLAKGNFDIYDLLFGLVLIFFIFWLFKVFDRQIISNLWKNVVKGLTFLSALILINVLIFQRYKNEVEKYFPVKDDKIIVDGTDNDGKIRILVTKFMPIKKTTIFNRDYTDLIISQLYYKKMLEMKRSDSIIYDQLCIDYSDQSLDITSENDFNKYCDNTYNDFLISGDFFDNNNEIFLCNSCYIVNEEYRSLLKKYSDGENNSKPEDDFIVLYNISPFNYYDIVFDQNKYLIDSTLCFDIKSLTKTSFDIQKSFPNDLSFISNIEVSPVIAFNYFRILIDWNKIDKQHQASNNPEAIDSIIGYFDNIQSICPNIDSSFIKNNHNDIELQIHLLLLKAYFINKAIHSTHGKNNDIITDDELKLWFRKTNYIGEALKISAKYRRINEMDLDYLMTSYWFVNYNKLAHELKLPPSLENPEIDSIDVAENPFRLTYQRQCTRSVMKEIDAQIQRYSKFGNAKYKSEDFFEIYSEMKKHIKKYYRE